MKTASAQIEISSLPTYNDGSCDYVIARPGHKNAVVRAKSIWRAYEAAVLTGDILVFESIANAKKESK